MIKFHCSNCGKKISTPDNYAGKRGKCPQCGQVVRVPSAQEEPVQDNQPVIKFRCPNCNQKIGVAKNYAGKRVRCAKCRQPIWVPEPQVEPVQKESVAGSVEADEMFDDHIAAGDIFGDKSMADELLAAEAGAPAVEEPLRLKPAVPQTVHSQAPAFGVRGQLTDNSVSGRSLTVGTSNRAVKIPLAIGASFIAALLGAILWAVVACVTRYECGIIAWGVGVLAGFGLTLFIDSRGVGIGLLACLFAFLGILMGKFFIANWYIMPRLEQEFRKFEPGEEHIAELLENSDMMFSVACLQLVENGEFEEALAWRVIAAHYSGELPSENRQEIEAARQKSLELLNNWSESEKKAAAQAQCAKLMDKITDFMIKTKIGLVIAFLAAFSLWDLLWLPIALWSAYKIGAGRE